MKQYNIDIACLAETNTNWNHPKEKKLLYKITKQIGKEVKCQQRCQRSLGLKFTNLVELQ